MSGDADPRGAPHLLVADDDADIAFLLQSVFERRGYRVTVAEDGLTALGAAQADTPDLLVLDRSMPGLSGLSVCRSLREAGASVPVVMLTASAGSDAVRLAREAGVTMYLLKPFVPRTLVERVDLLLEQAATRPTAPLPPVAQ